MMKSRNVTPIFAVAAALACLLFATAAQADTVTLETTTDSTGYISEDQLTGAFGRINLGDGTAGDADALYDIGDIDDPNPSLLGSPVDLFPREADFLVGSLETDPITGSGTETVAITSIDLGEFWTSAQTGDISDPALGIWFFDAPRSISFGALDGGDTATYVDGVLTSIDLNITTAFNLDLPAQGGCFITSAVSETQSLVWNGTFSITGNQLSYQIDDVEDFVDPNTQQPKQSNLIIDLTGTVDAVESE
jgi:hypothetical protein